MKSTGKRSVKDKEDRSARSKYNFDLNLDVKHPGTAILLLKCEEKEVLLTAATALCKFGSRARENLEILFDLKIVENVLPLIEHQDLFTRRFAAKLLAEMSAIPNVKAFLIQSDHYIPHFARVLINEKDTFMQEFSSMVLAELSKDPFGVAQTLNQCPDMNFLFERIQSPDPDVKKNNIEIMYNLMQDPTGFKDIVSTKAFNLTRIYDLYESPYPEIQRLALDVTRELISRAGDEQLQKAFRQTNGPQALLNLLEKQDWHDLHPEVLKILSLALDDDTNVDHLVNNAAIQRILRYIESPPNSRLYQEGLNVIAQFCNTPNGRKAAYPSRVLDYLLNGLRGPVQSDICEICCHGVGMMTLHDQAAKELTASGCVKNLLGILKNENLRATTRQTAAFALNELLKCDIQNCMKFLDIQGQSYLLWLVRQPFERVQVELQILSAECLTAIAGHSALRGSIIGPDWMEALCGIFESGHPFTTELKRACCSLLSILCLEEAGRDGFVRAHGPRRLLNLLTDLESVPIRTAAARLVLVLASDPILSDAFVQEQYLSYMLNNRSVSWVAPVWESCIQALLDSHLPVKFAITGRLSLRDITKDGFYVLRRNVCRFPVLNEMFRLKYCPIEPVYVVNCSPPPARHSDDLTSERRSSMKEGRRGIFLSAEEVKDWLELKFGRLQPDPPLYDSVELFKCKLVANESRITLNMEPGLVNIRVIESRARMLARFVARQMSGPDPAATCVDHQLEIHLKEIKGSLETSVIPLGSIRVGSYLERALLFKAIADRIALPASLVRGQYGRSWIEVAVPQTEDWPRTSVDHQCRTVVLPSRLMRPNFIVDLMDKPGDLIPIGSHRAKLYCQKRSLRRTRS